MPGHTLFQHSPLAGQDSDCCGKLRVQRLGKRFGKDVGEIRFGRYVNDVDHSVVDMISQEVRVDVDVLGSRVEFEVVRDGDGGLVVGLHDLRCVHCETEFFEEIPDPQDLFRSVHNSCVFGFGGRQGYSGLLFRTPGDGSPCNGEDVSTDRLAVLVGCPIGVCEAKRFDRCGAVSSIGEFVIGCPL